MFPDVTQWTEEVLDLKELFMIFDTDNDGVLTFTQLKSVMGTLGTQIKGLKLVDQS